MIYYIHIHPYMKHQTHLRTGVTLVIDTAINVHNGEPGKSSITAEASQELGQVGLTCKLSQVSCNAKLVRRRGFRGVIQRFIQQS
jgi:hypothetical protein